MVRRVFGFYLLRSIYGELRDRSHHIIVYFWTRLPLSVALYTIERVLLSDAPSPLPLSPCSLSDPPSTSI